MKKWIALILILVVASSVVIAIAGCGKEEKSYQQRYDQLMKKQIEESNREFDKALADVQRQLKEGMNLFSENTQTTQASQSIPRLISPAERATITSGTIPNRVVNSPYCQDVVNVAIDFDWSDVVGAQAYELYISGSLLSLSAHVDPYIDIDRIYTSSYHLLGDFICEGCPWHWKVRAKVQGTWQEWSDGRRFCLQPSQ
jgi:hypothetical protein